LQKGIIYFDNAATSLTPEQVVKAVVGYYHNYRANIHRGVHRLSMEASKAYEEAHKKVGSFIGARPEEIIFTKNTTEAINLVALSMEWERGDKIVTSTIEHHSDMLPWMRLRKKGVEVVFVKEDKEGIIDMGDLEAKAEGAKLISVVHASNVLGCVSPVREIGRVAKKSGALFLVDGAQSVPHLPVDVKEIGCDFLAFSGHKMLGPTGIGALFMRKELAEKIEPAMLGGGTINRVTLDGYELAKLPDRWEAGTPNIAGAIGFGVAIDYLKGIGMENIERYEAELTKQVMEGLDGMDKIEYYGPRDISKKVGVVAFNVKGMKPHDTASMLDSIANIAVRSGHHCAMPLAERVIKRPEGTVRASFYIYNTAEEVDKLIKTLKEIVKIAP
ncbi:MAG: aminotransferase class V-fold PLP-dependent enzyme, partial [Candidatus Aenigmatarchaeota archaeon]